MTPVTDPLTLAAYASDASGLVATPLALYRPADTRELIEVVNECARTHLALTPQGSRTSTTGAAVPQHSAALSLEKLTGIIDLDPQKGLVVVRPGTILGDLKRALADANCFYPPDPTSENECTVGGSIACNASGARTLAYGPTRDHVEALELVFADGTTRRVTRSHVTKNASGYFGVSSLLDLIIGSEGTLAIVTEATLRIAPRIPRFAAGMAFFTSLDAAVAFALAASPHRPLTVAPTARPLAPRCLELFDERALHMIASRATAMKPPAEASAAIYFEQEFDPEAHPEAATQTLEAWFDALAAHPDALAAETLVADTTARVAELRTLRHHLPSAMIEEGFRARANGGRRVSTDWAVPPAHLADMMRFATDLCLNHAPSTWVAYGHIGNAHPHFNLVARDADQLVTCQRLVTQMIDRALALGGTVSAEHGIGKIKHAFAQKQFGPLTLAAMRAVKHTFDPHGMLAPHNLFA